MPIDRMHAFGNEAARGPPAFLTTLTWRALRAFSARADARCSIAQAWAQFRRFSTLPSSCRLGSHAWCINMSNDPSRIMIDEGVVCRGLLRVESFGTGRLLIRSNAYIGDDVLLSCADQIVIGSNALIAHGVQIFDNNTHPTNWQDREMDWQSINSGKARLHPAIASAPVHIGDHAWIGFNCIILKGVSVGQRSIVAAGSVVTSDVPPDTVVGGNPARVLRTLDNGGDEVPNIHSRI
jgi:acetyltransferase-like isoleucine patch superfamily enzyme